MHTKFRKDCFSHSKVDGRVIHRQHGDRMSLLSFLQIMESMLLRQTVQILQPADTKGNCPVVQCLIKHYATKMYGRMGIQVHVFLTSPLDGSGKPPPPVTLPPEKIPRHSLNSRAGIPAMEKRQFSCLAGCRDKLIK
jgi:hypothetical protein